MRNPKMKTPIDRNKHPKSFKEVVLDHLEGTQKNVLSIKKDMRKQIIEEVTKQFDDKKIMLEGLYKEILIEKRLLQKRGQITQEDINEMYEELKKKVKNG